MSDSDILEDQGLDHISSRQNYRGLATTVNATSVVAVPSASAARAPLHTPARMEIKAPPPSSIDPSKETMKSFIAADDTFVGDLNCKAGIRVCGTVQGSVICSSGTVYVEYGGVVTGSIESVSAIFIDGSVGTEGGDNPVSKITTPGKITLMNRCVVNADVFYGQLASEDDMTLNGTTRKLTKPAI